MGSGFWAGLWALQALQGLCWDLQSSSSIISSRSKEKGITLYSLPRQSTPQLQLPSPPPSPLTPKNWCGQKCTKNPQGFFIIRRLREMDAQLFGAGKRQGRGEVGEELGRAPASSTSFRAPASSGGFGVRGGGIGGTYQCITGSGGLGGRGRGSGEHQRVGGEGKIGEGNRSSEDSEDQRIRIWWRMVEWC